jgi:hypothetical protein
MSDQNTSDSSGSDDDDEEESYHDEPEADEDDDDDDVEDEDEEEEEDLMPEMKAPDRKSKAQKSVAKTSQTPQTVPSDSAANKRKRRASTSIEIASESAKNTTAKKRTKRKSSESDVVIGPLDDDLTPSFVRRTDRGGYAHTHRSRLKISLANKGNEPWNKGRNRSGADRAKISAGVKARNRAVLLERLKKMNMTEEEWWQKKRELKLIREKIRRTKRQNEERFRNVEKERKVEQEAREAWRITDMHERQLIREEEARLQREHEEKVRRMKAESESARADQEKRDLEDLKAQLLEKEQQEGGTFPGCFTRDYQWTEHSYDDGKVSYKDICPNNGPGGLLCCAWCTRQYSKYMSMTLASLQEQKQGNTYQELTQLMDILQDSRALLASTVQAARRKPPPLLTATHKLLEGMTKMKRCRHTVKAKPEDLLTAFQHMSSERQKLQSTLERQDNAVFDDSDESSHYDYPGNVDTVPIKGKLNASIETKGNDMELYDDDDKSEGSKDGDPLRGDKDEEDMTMDAMKWMTHNRDRKDSIFEDVEDTAVV